MCIRDRLNIKNSFGNLRIFEDEYGISPGQACVFYHKDDIGERLLGGGWIDRTVNKNLSTQFTEQ